MSSKTKNIYGKIVVTDRTIEKFIEYTAIDSYGLVGFSHQNFFDAVLNFFNSAHRSKGVKVQSVGDRLYIDVYVVIKYGLSISAVVESLKEAIRYKVEFFTGMVVDTVNVYVKGLSK